MSRISLEKRIKSDGALASYICQERFLDLNLVDWMIYSNSTLSDEELYKEIDELFRFYYEGVLLSQLNLENAYNEFKQLSICEALRILSNARHEDCISAAREFALKIIVNGFLPMIKDESCVNWDILSQLIDMQLCEDYIPFPD